MNSRPPKQDSRPLGDFRSHDAYVLLGDPGAGKTTAFEDEAKVLGDYPHVVSARDFLFPEDVLPEWRDKTLFIDGLDEVRAGVGDARTPFEAIRGRLIALGRPRFRLSCREADWLGENDRRHLAKVAPGGQVTVVRLDPLTESDIVRILESRTDISDPKEFFLKARDRGVDGLLANPQTLNMLADVVGGGGEWPDSRWETFERACLRIAREHNEEHQASMASGSTPRADQLLDAAGRLCVVHLLTGTAGYSSQYDDDDGYLNPDRCDYKSHDMLRHALRTKLFRSQSDNRLAPIHRHIAEYLGARHLAWLVEEHRLPACRILALMVGNDGTVVTEMRGLSAWFAAQCPAARLDLIDRDPIGVGQYGDIHKFTLHEKQALLQAMGRDVPGHDLEFGVAAGFRALATPDLEPAFERVLTSPRRDKEYQEFICLVLDILMESASTPGLSETLLGVVRDEAWWSGVRRWALDAFFNNCPVGDKSERLGALLADIREGNVSDPDDDLLGTLLDRLYPQDLSTREVWDHFSRQQNPDHFGRYRWFWERLAETSPGDHVVKHLDHLSRRPPRSGASLYLDHFSRLRLGLVARGLDLYGDKLVSKREIARLYDWLGVASVRDRNYLGDRDETVNDIREWLVARPQVQKAVILEGLKRCPDDDGFRLCARDVQERLYHSTLPPDFGLWCLNQAVGIEDEAPRVAEHLLERAFWALDDDRINQGLSLHRIQEGTKGSDRLKTVLARLRRPRTVSASEAELAKQVRQYESQRREERARELDYLRSQEAILLDNQAPPGLLYQLARIYFADFKEIAADKGAGARAIEARCAGDRPMVEAILSSFRGVLSRKDVPTLKEIVRACRENRLYHLGLPFLAGSAEVERTQPQTLPVPEPSDNDDPIPSERREDVLPSHHVHKRGIPGDTDVRGRTRSDELSRLAVAFYFATIHGAYSPSWYQMLLDEHPEIVADVQPRIASATIRGGHAVDCRLYDLAYTADYAPVARRSTLNMLRAFPLRCKRHYAQQLDYLLLAALQHCERGALRQLITTKLSRPSMGVWQRVHWLAAGLFAWPGSFADALRNHAEGREKRLAELSVFLSRAGNVARLVGGLGYGAVALLVRLLGRSVDPERFVDSSNLGIVHDVTPMMERSRLVQGLIHRLTSSPSREASELLKDLTGDEVVAAWWDEFRRARESQRIIRRDDGYRHPNVGEICRTLRGAEPANVADLATLVEDHLRQLADLIRHGDADGWAQFWNQDQYCRPTRPKPEPACRDVLHFVLPSHLPQSLEVTKEAHHARDNRSDLRVSYLGRDGERFHVPVEIKPNWAPDLWTAVENQLIEKYAIDPAASGYGIYLVLWFGKVGKKDTKRSPDGGRPGNARELEDRLREQLSRQKGRKISVCVMNVSGDASRLAE